MKRFARTLIIGMFIFVIAVTPLSAFTSGGLFETWLIGDGHGYGSNPTVRVVLEDHTGMVRAIGPASAQRRDAAEDRAAKTNVVVVTWIGGCGDQTAHLTMDRAEDGYLIRERTDGWGCGLSIGYGRSVAITLWAPVRASAVQFIPYP